MNMVIANRCQIIILTKGQDWIRDSIDALAKTIINEEINFRTHV